MIYAFVLIIWLANGESPPIKAYEWDATPHAEMACKDALKVWKGKGAYHRGICIPVLP